EGPDDRSSHRGHLGYTNTVMRPIKKVQEVEEDSDRDMVDLGMSTHQPPVICC
ncbi:hypothetical protein K443DRAFT_77664, partial [Laccaria amethystina LaAM-08-1]